MRYGTETSHTRQPSYGFKGRTKTKSSDNRLCRLIHLPLTLTYHRLSNLVDMQVIQEPFIDNIFSNVISKDINCSNITVTISDDLLQFLISPNTFSDSPSSISNAFEGESSKFDQENFVLDYYDID